jgi:hypothetical protein
MHILSNSYSGIYLVTLILYKLIIEYKHNILFKIISYNKMFIHVKCYTYREVGPESHGS